MPNADAPTLADDLREMMRVWDRLEATARACFPNTICDALTLAAALEVLAPAPDGAIWTALCVWCLHRFDPHERCHSRRAGGDCMRCAYTGRDTHVALVPSDGAPLPYAANLHGFAKRWPEHPVAFAGGEDRP